MNSKYVDVSMVKIGAYVRFPCGCRAHLINRHLLLGTHLEMDYTRMDCREGMHRMSDFYVAIAYPAKRIDDFIDLLVKSFGDLQAELSPDPDCRAPLLLEIDPSTGAAK